MSWNFFDLDFTTSLETSTTEASTTEITTTIDPTVNTTDKQTAEPSTSTSTITSTIPQPTATEPNQYPEFYMTRDDWGAEPPRSLNISKLETPATRIIVGHTGGKFCFNVVSLMEPIVEWSSNFFGKKGPGCANSHGFHDP